MCIVQLNPQSVHWLCHIHVWKFSHSVLSQRQTLVFQSPYPAFSWATPWHQLFVGPLYLTWFSGFSRSDHKQQFTSKHSDVTIQGPLLNVFVILRSPRCALLSINVHKRGYNVGNIKDCKTNVQVARCSPRCALLRTESIVQNMFPLNLRFHSFWVK